MLFVDSGIPQQLSNVLGRKQDYVKLISGAPITAMEGSPPNQLFSKHRHIKYSKTDMLLYVCLS